MMKKFYFYLVRSHFTFRIWYSRGLHQTQKFFVSSNLQWLEWPPFPSRECRNWQMRSQNVHPKCHFFCVFFYFVSAPRETLDHSFLCKCFSFSFFSEKRKENIYSAFSLAVSLGMQLSDALKLCTENENDKIVDALWIKQSKELNIHIQSDIKSAQRNFFCLFFVGRGSWVR